MINQEACICKSITHYLYDSLRNTLIPLQGDQTFIMKNKQPNTNIIIKPDQAARLDILINHQLFKPRYRRVNHKDY